jgi:hypothetical protein
MDNVSPMTQEDKLQRDALTAAFWNWLVDSGITAEVTTTGQLVLIEQSLQQADELIETFIDLPRYED